MRVLQFYRTYLPETQGGLEEAIRQICLATRKHGVEHRVLTLARVDREERLVREEAEVIRVPLQIDPASCSMGVKTFRAFREQAEWADIIHIHYPWPFADLVHLLSGTKKPVVLTYHSDIIRQRALEKLYAPLRSVFFRKVDRVVATSPNYVRTSPLLQHLRRAPEVIPLGLDPESYPAADAETIKTVERNFGRDFFLFVGVLRYYKGLHTLISAAAKTGLPVVIAGDGPEAPRLRAQIRALGGPDVYLAGRVSDPVKAALMECCRAVVFPSCERSEAFGVTLLEGQLHQKALISTEIGTGTSFVNVDGETGLIVPPNDPDALAAAMQRLNDDAQLANRLGLAGRQRLEALFSGEHIGRQYLQLYQELLEERRTANN
ncbi:glycosyltransferase [Gilvimarinus sp. F26214L]|uniref:glycosyltransferase n=1 Tax=Gilvimarinus sp. DZF01 TaxID=3461371 RepID=UPI004045ECAA